MCSLHRLVWTNNHKILILSILRHGVYLCVMPNSYIIPCWPLQKICYFVLDTNLHLWNNFERKLLYIDDILKSNLSYFLHRLMFIWIYFKSPCFSTGIIWSRVSCSKANRLQQTCSGYGAHQWLPTVSLPALCFRWTDFHTLLYFLVLHI